MKLVELLDVASSGYPDELTREYYDPATGAPAPGSGDTLADFIVSELRETFEEGQSDEDQLGDAVQHLRDAVRDLEGVIRALGG